MLLGKKLQAPSSKLQAKQPEYKATRKAKNAKTAEGKKRGRMEQDDFSAAHPGIHVETPSERTNGFTNNCSITTL